MDAEFLKVAYHDPTGIHVVWQKPRVAPRLLEGRKH